MPLWPCFQETAMYILTLMSKKGEYEVWAQRSHLVRFNGAPTNYTHFYALPAGISDEMRAGAKGYSLQSQSSAEDFVSIHVPCAALECGHRAALTKESVQIEVRPGARGRTWFS